MPTTLITDTSIVLPLQGFKGDKGDTGPVGATGPPAPSTLSHDANNKATLGSDTYFLVLGVGSGLPATSHVTVVSGDDPQLTNARIPLPHALSHRAGSGDALAIDVLALPSDNTNLNATTSYHGLLRKLDGNAAHVLDGTGAWSTPAGGGNMSKSDYDTNNDLIVDHAHLADVAFPSAHASTHNAGGSDLLAPATSTATGLVPTPPNDGGKHLSGLATFTQVIPAGVIMPFGGSSAPVGFLICDGTSYPTASFPVLFSVLGYTYGGSGPNFSVPDLRSRTVVGAGQGTGLSNRVLGGTTGEETHTLSIAELASHTHTIADHSHTIPGAGNHTHSCTEPDHYHLLAAHTHNMDHFHNIGAGQFSHAHNFTAVLGAAGGSYQGGNPFSPSTATTAAATLPAGNTVYASQTNGAWVNTGGPSPNNTNWLSQTMALPTFNTAASGNITPGTANTSLAPASTGSGTPHNVMQPSLFLNYVIKV